MLVNIANAQAGYGAEVYVVIVNDLIEPALLNTLTKNVKMILLRRKMGSRNPLSFLKLNLILRRIQPDVVHLHRSDLFQCLWFAQLGHVACITLHDLPWGNVRRESLWHKLFHYAHTDKKGNVMFIDRIPKVFSISDAVKDMLHERYGIKSVVVNNGILTSKFKQSITDACQSPFKVIQVSRLEHGKKGQDLLIEAAAKLRGKIDVTFIGEGSSMEFLKNLTQKLYIHKYVHFLGKRDQSFIAQHLCEYGLFVQPSRWEGFGLTVAEAMAAKVPVLVSAGQGPAEVTCDEKFGWTFVNGDVDDLVQKIAYVMNHNTEVSAKAEAGYTHVVTTYDVSVTAKKYLENY